jgi:hypothetical protein
MRYGLTTPPGPSDGLGVATSKADTDCAIEIHIVIPLLLSAKRSKEDHGIPLGATLHACLNFGALLHAL